METTPAGDGYRLLPCGQGATQAGDAGPASGTRRRRQGRHRPSDEGHRHLGAGCRLRQTAGAGGRGRKRPGAGLFTPVLLKGLRGGAVIIDRDGYINMEELTSYARREVPRFSQQRCSTSSSRYSNSAGTISPSAGRGTMKIIAAILEPAVITKILADLGLPTRAPPRAPARSFNLFEMA